MASIEQKILDQIRQLRSARQSVSNEQQWIQNLIDDQHLREIIPKLSIVSLHIATALLDGEMTGIELARQLNVTRGGITRAAKSLLSYQLVVDQKHAGDKKKIYYSLTTAGRKVAIGHQRMHEKMDQTFAKKMDQRYTQAELARFSQMLEEVQQLEKEFF